MTPITPNVNRRRKNERVTQSVPAPINKTLKLINIFWGSIFPSIVFLINYTIYTTTPNWARQIYADDYLHFFGGASIAFSASYLISILENKGRLVIRNNLIKLFIIVSAVALAAILWEFYEFVMDILYTPIYQPSVEDTMKDLIMGITGGTFLAGILIFWKTKTWREKI